MQSWSIAGFLKSLVPWSSAETSVEDETAIQEDIPITPSSPAVSLRDRGYQTPDRSKFLKLECENNETEPSSLSIPPPPRLSPSPKPSAKSILFDPTSPERNLETVSAHIRESLDRKDVRKLCAMLQGGPSEEVLQPFRFSATPSTSGRGISPFQGNNNDLGSTFGVSSTASVPMPSLRKTLNRNPNGVYRWQGGGSAKTPRSKNRYSSPAFGPSRSTSDHLVLKDTRIGTETPRTDTKRRKVVEDINPSSTSNDSSSSSLLNSLPQKPPARAAAPDPSPTRIKQALPFPVSAGSPVTSRTSNNSTSSNTSSSQPTSRLRVPPIAQKLTAPVIPSPLRQAWSGASPPSQSDPPTMPSPPKQTKAANYMAQLIKEVTPPKRPDLSNPYQIASPLGKVGPAPRRVSRRVRATGKPTVPVNKDEKSKEKDSKAADQEKVFSPQAIIEATLPKGSKRSRPPAHLEKAPISDSESSLPKQPSQIASSSSNPKRYNPYVEDEIDEEDEDARRTVKKSKSQSTGRSYPTAINKSKPNSPDIVVEEIEVDASITPEKPQSVTSPPASSSTPTTSARPAFSASKATSIPKEPSKLRFSYQPERTSSPAPEVTAPTSTMSASPLSNPPSTSRPVPFSSVSASTPAASLSFPSSTPAFTPPAFLSFPPSTETSKPSVAPSPSFPSTGGTSLASMENFSGHSTNIALKPGQQAALKVPTPSLPSFTFSVGVGVPAVNSAHVKAMMEARSIPKSSLPSFDFSKGAVPTMSSASEKASSTTPPTSAPVVPFNWAGAGVKPPVSSNGTTWTCSLCMLTNPMSSTEQCEHCETKRPVSIATVPVASPTPVAPKPSAPVVQQFDWAAAGIKPPTTGDSWICSLCGLSNPASATDKCNTCDNPHT
ncbi:hypothetical protein C0995_008493 [Termitomyces sp. Mi166|nr:hypothetical protein C0995_008493 [Termitomyces sp. Mi166\